MAASLEPWEEEAYQGLEDVLEVRGEGGPSREADLPAWAAPYQAELWATLRRAVESRNLSSFLDWTGEAVGRLLAQNVPFPEVMARLGPGDGWLYDAVTRAHGEEPGRALRMVRALSRLNDAVASRAGEVYAAWRADEVKKEQRRIIRELSTPVIEVWDGILIMPLVGMVDSGRAKQMMEQLLNRIVETESRIVILDVTGVPSIDSGVADHLLRTTRAARLVGVRSILAGISPQVAVTLVRMGVSFGDLETVGDLRSGLALALELLGYKVVGPGS